MDATARWSQGIGVVKSLEEKKAIRTQKPQALNCPRCNSSHTKFCYYNNYNILSQPRYFCKACTRYWTAGGSLRNVPVGGGSRKTKRSSSSNINHHHHMTMTQPSSSSNLVSQNPNLQHVTRGNEDHLMGIFKARNDHARGMMMMMMMNSFIPTPLAGSYASNTMVMNGFENDGGYDDQNNGIIRAVSATPTAASTSARLFFPLQDLKPPSASTSDNQVQQDSNCNAYWIGGGSL